MPFQALIRRAVAGSYYVIKDNIEYDCKPKGIFRNEDITPLVGDIALFEPLEDNEGVITELLPRKNRLTRPAVANIDKLFIVLSTTKPTPNLAVADTLIAVCEYNGIEPIIVFTKVDLKKQTELARIYREAGFTVIEADNINAVGIEEVKPLLANSVSVFTGNTGVGKSSLINNLFPQLKIETSAISEKLGRGKHTTRTVVLYEIPEISAFVGDTPGFGTAELLKYEIIRCNELANCFREFREYNDRCKYSDCSHTVEQGCAVLEGVKKGEISASRHENYKTLYEQTKKIKEWEQN